MNKCGFNSSLSVFYPNDLFKVKAAMWLCELLPSLDIRHRLFIFQKSSSLTSLSQFEPNLIIGVFLLKI
jgi:hypothetical protein